MKRAFPLSLVLILCTSFALSQERQLSRNDSKSERPAATIPRDSANDSVGSSTRPPAPNSVVPATTSVAPQNPLTLQWELVNPFRFISQDAFDEIRGVYDEMNPNEKTAYDLERAIQKRSDDDVKGRRSKAGNCDNPKSKDEKKGCFEPYLGWFAKLADNHYEKTCWNSETHQFRDEGECKDYIYPKSHRVRVWIENSQLLGNRVPQWFMDNQPIPASAQPKDCDAKYQKGLCIELDINYDGRAREISAKFPDNSFTLKPIPVLVEDKLIVGLGDSYASGEGNPDIPAQFTQGETDLDVLPELLAKDILNIFKGIREPKKDDGTEAAWLDKRCHRSMYSYQFKTALQIALASPRQAAITYVSYSCSGATTDQIIDEEQKANEGGGKLRPQLATLRKVLSNGAGKTREIDYLLLSTGGNDIHFADLVAYIVLPKRLLPELKLFRKVSEETIINESEEKGFEKLLLGRDGSTGNYQKLHDALLNGPEKDKAGESARIRIKDCDPHKPCPRILLTPYPDVFHNEDGKLCEADRNEFDIPFAADETRVGRIVTVNRYVFEQIRDVQQNSRLHAELGWTVVESNVLEYSKHGFCARNAKSESKTAEIFEMPTCKDKRCEGKRWKHLDPREYKSYETRQRWIRLPVDSKLTTDQMHKIFGIPIDIALEDDRSNIMHPTAEGLSKTADANVEAIKKLEGKEN